MLYNNITPAMPQGYEHLALRVLCHNPKKLVMALKTGIEWEQARMTTYKPGGNFPLIRSMSFIISTWNRLHQLVINTS